MVTVTTLPPPALDAESASLHLDVGARGAPTSVAAGTVLVACVAKFGARRPLHVERPASGMLGHAATGVGSSAASAGEGAEAGAGQAAFDWNPKASVERTQLMAGRGPAPARARAKRPASACADLGAEDHRLRWLTADEATAHLGFPSRKALYAAVERGQVPVHKLGRRLRFRRTELDALLDRGR
jgi:excisionase family DNA binding protein